MTRSNKAYTIEQYNKARRNRGHAPIPNPFKEGGEKFRLLPGTSLAAKFPSFVGVETVTPVSENTKTIYPKGHAKFDPIVKYLTKQADVGIEDYSDEELNNLFTNPSFLRLIDQANVTSSTISPSVSDPLNTAGPSGVTKSKSTTQSTPHEFEPPTKKPNVSSTEMSTGIGTGRGSSEAPGSILDENMRTSTMDIGMGPGTSGGLAMEKGEFIPDVPRPYNFRMMDGFGHVTTAFSVLSYGFASRIIPHPKNVTPLTAADAYVVLATTPLLEIPWDRVNMYLSPGVYDSLPIGSYVKSVHCKVIQRNIRVAFETAQSTTTLATLNQNKFSLMAVGLNNKNDIRVSNMRYTVGELANAMIPTAVTDPNYDDIDECLYAYSQSQQAFNGGDVLNNNPYAIPCSFFSFNTTIHPRNYLVAWNCGYKAPASTANVKDRGWYNLSGHVRKVPTGKVIDTPIIDESYYPTYAPLKGQLEFAEYLRDTIKLDPPTGTTAVSVNLGSLSFDDHNIGKTFDRSLLTGITAASNANPTETQTALTTNRNNFTLQVSRKTLIEKGQFYKQIDADHNGKYVQPSIHVGVAAVPKLTTSTMQLLPADFTDVQSYFDVELSMVIGFNYAHQNTYQNVFNINANEVRMAVDTSAAGNRPTFKLPNRFGHQACY